MNNIAFKFRLYSTEEQHKFFQKTFDCVRFIYNKMLEDKINHYKNTKEMLYNTPAQYKDKYPFLKEVDSMALANVQQNLTQAYKNFFNNPKFGFPKFKSKKSNNKSYTTNLINGNIELSNGFLKFPKVGKVKIEQHRPVPTNFVLKSVTVSQDPDGKYYASILFEYDLQIQQITPQSFIGLDFSMKDLYCDSNGYKPGSPKFFKQSEEKLAREQRKLKHMQKGSHNYEKQRIKIAMIYKKMSNQCKDFLHKESTQIANVYDCVCIESLNMKEMSQKMNFGKSVHDNGWGMFVGFLSYKLLNKGKRLVKVGKYFPSSQLCNVCGYKNSDVKNLSIREWDCPNCGSHHDRDVNAAINIRNEGMRLLAA